MSYTWTCAMHEVRQQPFQILQNPMPVADEAFTASARVFACKHACCLSHTGEPWEFCPRNALRKALAALQAEFGITMKVTAASKACLTAAD